jgi:hypothetical protein
MDTSRFTLPPESRLVSRFRLGVRRLVVATSGTPLRHIYIAIYNWHIWYAVHLLKQFRGLQSIYLTGGIAAGELQPGISDIDLTVNGDFTPEEHKRVAGTLRKLSLMSPLYDTLLGQCVQTIEGLKSLYATDYFFQYRFSQGRSQWKLLYGDDVFSMLPPLPDDRAAGCYYTEVRTCWSYFVKSAFGSGPTARDSIFRRSIAYKTYAGLMRLQQALESGNVEPARRKVMAAARESAAGPERKIIECLERSADSRYLRYEGQDVRQDALELLLPLLESVHSKLPNSTAFRSMHGGRVSIDGAASEMMRTAAADEHIAQVIAYVRREWSGYRAAFVTPCISFFYPDDLVLLIEVDPDRIPLAREIRELCRFHAGPASRLQQRVALFLLLPNGAYQLEIVSAIEQWHHLLCPAANPEVFALIERPEFAVDGAERRPLPAPIWSRFAYNLVDEEITIRRAAMAKAITADGVNSLEALRNLWRHLQLEIIHRTSQAGCTVIPVTIPAMRRALQGWGVPDLPVFQKLAAAYDSELRGSPVDIRPLMAEVMGLLTFFQ